MLQSRDSRRRYPELDIIRLLALSMIPAVHFFMYTGFYESEPSWPGYGAVLLIRVCLTATLPLFIMLTGYLLCRAGLRPGWWKPLGKTLLIYVLSCIPCYFFRRAADAEYAPSAAGVFWSVLSFDLNPYSWYIGLYIGLFLLVPFLNRLHENLDRKWHGVLVLVLFALISLPSLTNSFLWFSPEFWRHPASVTEYNRILPDYWVQLPYALLYYEMGAWLRLHPPKIRARRLFLLLAGLSVLFTGYTAWRQDGQAFSVFPWVNHSGFVPAVLTPLTFCFLVRAFGSRVRKEKTVRVLAFLSDLCLGAYLLSYCTDLLIYRICGFPSPSASFQENFVWFPLTAVVNTVLSLFLSLLITVPAKWILRRSNGRKSPSEGPGPAARP